MSSYEINDPCILEHFLLQIAWKLTEASNLTVRYC